MNNYTFYETKNTLKNKVKKIKHITFENKYYILKIKFAFDSNRPLIICEPKNRNEAYQIQYIHGDNDGELSYINDPLLQIVNINDIDMAINRLHITKRCYYEIKKTVDTVLKQYSKGDFS